MTVYVPIRFTRSVRSKTSSESVSSRPTILAAAAIPAQFTTARGAPRSLTALAKASETASASATSATIAVPPQTLATSSACGPEISSTDTCDPADAKYFAVAAPRPLPAPVTRAWHPFRSKSSSPQNRNRPELPSRIAGSIGAAAKQLKGNSPLCCETGGHSGLRRISQGTDPCLQSGPNQARPKGPILPTAPFQDSRVPRVLPGQNAAQTEQISPETVVGLHRKSLVRTCQRSPIQLRNATNLGQRSSFSPNGGLNIRTAWDRISAPHRIDVPN